MTTNQNQLMACFVELSSNKERTTLEQSVIKTLCQLQNCPSYLFHLYDGRGEFNPHLVLSGDIQGEVTSNKRRVDEVNKDLGELIPHYLESLNHNEPRDVCQQGEYVFWPLMSGENCINIIVIPKNDCDNQCVVDYSLLNAISCIFTNFIALLDAGERDALTGLFNRRIFDTRLSTMARNENGGKAMSEDRRQPNDSATNYLGIIDIDYFKRVNDDYGHLFGDEVLLWLAQNMRQCFRNEDSLFRYGGEEFAVLLSGLTQAQAQEAFERFRRTIANTDFPQIGRITVSIGYSCIDKQANPTLVFGDADKALYYAKEHGRNRVECYQKLLLDGLIDQDKNESAEIEIF